VTSPLRLRSRDCETPYLVEKERWLRAWYDVLRTLPSARGLKSDLWVLEQPPQEADAEVFGHYDDRDRSITVYVVPNDYEMVATLLHEMAHALGNLRHRRHHGYSWRRKFAELAWELLGMDPLPVADQFRKIGPDNGKKNPSRQSALDGAVLALLIEQRVRLVLYTRSRVVAVAGGNLFEVNRRGDLPSVPSRGVP